MSLSTKKYYKLEMFSCYWIWTTGLKLLQRSCNPTKTRKFDFFSFEVISKKVVRPTILSFLGEKRLCWLSELVALTSSWIYYELIDMILIQAFYSSQIINAWQKLFCQKWRWARKSKSEEGLEQILFKYLFSIVTAPAISFNKAPC